MRNYYANTNMLLRKFSYLSPDVKCCKFKSYCSTMYCSCIWFDSTIIYDIYEETENCLH